MGEETYRNWIQDSYSSMSSWLYYMAKGMIKELGEKQGTELFLKQVIEKGHSMGENAKNMIQSKGLENNLVNFVNPDSESSVYSFAWEGKTKRLSDDEVVVEWTKCPIAQGFKNHGPEGERIGEIFCNHVDNATAEAYNPDYVCVRETSLHKDGVCTLHFKLKD